MECREAFHCATSNKSQDLVSREETNATWRPPLGSHGCGSRGDGDDGDDVHAGAQNCAVAVCGVGNVCMPVTVVAFGVGGQPLPFGCQL